MYWCRFHFNHLMWSLKFRFQIARTLLRSVPVQFLQIVYSSSVTSRLFGRSKTMFSFFISFNVFFAEYSNFRRRQTGSCVCPSATRYHSIQLATFNMSTTDSATTSERFLGSLGSSTYGSVTHFKKSAGEITPVIQRFRTVRLEDS